MIAAVAAAAAAAAAVSVEHARGAPARAGASIMVPAR
jgi:hypothetical protein